MDKEPSSNTVWKKHVKDGFTDASNNSLNDKANITNYGHDFDILSTDDEKILSSPANQSQMNDIVLPEVAPTFTEQMNDLIKNLDPQQLKQMYKNKINSLKDSLKNLINNLASPFASLFFNDINSPEAKKEMGMISSQISTWITATVITYIVVLNWWYVWCYTNFHMDFRNYILHAFHWIIAPVLNAVELINYYVLTVRMDANAKFPTTDMMRTMWDWRPIVFCVFHVVVMSVLLSSNVSDGVASAMMNDGLFFALMSFLSMYYFGSLFVQEKWADKFLNAGFMGILIFTGMIIGAIIGMFLFIIIICPLSVVYISFFSYWSLLVFNYFSPFAVYNMVTQIFQELKESPVPGMNGWDSVSTEVFQNSHTIYQFAVVFAILIANIRQSSFFTNKSLMAVAIILNLLIASIVSSGSYSIMYNAVLTFINMLFAIPKVTIPPESNKFD